MSENSHRSHLSLPVGVWCHYLRIYGGTDGTRTHTLVLFQHSRKSVQKGTCFTIKLPTHKFWRDSFFDRVYHISRKVPLCRHKTLSTKLSYAYHLVMHKECMLKRYYHLCFCVTLYNLECLTRDDIRRTLNHNCLICFCIVPKINANNDITSGLCPVTIH